MLYFKGANAALIVYDVTDRRSFEKAKYWSNQVSNYEGETKIATFVIANKVDLCERQEVSSKESDEFTQSIGAFGPFEVSAKDGTGINELFEDTAQKLHKLHEAEIERKEIVEQNDR